jgi:RNA methyltransferase, trmH family
MSANMGESELSATPGPTEWGQGQHGVGPWEVEHPGEPAPVDDPRYDPELLAMGDRRNVVDAYRYLRREAIVADIDTRRHALHIAIENFENDANIGTVVRTANAFAVDTVHIVGRRRWNRRGAMVTDRYQHLLHHDTTDSVVAWAVEHGLTVVAIDNTPGSVPLETVELPKRCLLLFGQEGPGVTAAAQAAAVMTCSIAQFGSTRSINAGVAAGIAMHAWIRQHADLSLAW